MSNSALKTEPNTGIFQNFHAAIVGVPDVDKARDWYENVLELKPAKIMEGEHGGSFMAIYRLDTTTHLCLFLSPEAGQGLTANGLINFRTDDIEGVRAKLIERGTDCTEANNMGAVSYFTLKDPFGNRIDVCQFTKEWLPYLS
ncbi:MAG: VOC family protein [Pseudomonadota bacterium]